MMKPSPEEAHMNRITSVAIAGIAGLIVISELIPARFAPPLDTSS
jgi:hypothetical protein